MAKVDNNLFLLGATGMVGKQMVFRNRKGKIILSKRPRRTKNRTAPQLEQMARFKEAAIYAKAALADEEAGKAYNAKAQNSDDALSAYNIAMADYLNVPVIRQVNLDEYSGQAGERIVVAATDDFQVKEVAVEIRQSDDTLVEKGKAVASGNGLEWEYTTLSVNPSPTGSIVTVHVADLPGNITVEEVLI